MRVNIRTAEPVLLYLLADAGFEPPLIPVREGWDIFQKFLAMPAESQSDVASFQTTWIRENPANPVYSVLFSRQLTDPDEHLGSLTRAVGLQFLFDDTRRDLSEAELWSNDFSDLKAFVEHVEDLREFEYSLDATPTEGDVVIDEK
jgi:hypothetical protein